MVIAVGKRCAYAEGLTSGVSQPTAVEAAVRAAMGHHATCPIAAPERT